MSCPPHRGVFFNGMMYILCFVKFSQVFKRGKSDTHSCGIIP
jgi:hypothetical protein